MALVLIYPSARDDQVRTDPHGGVTIAGSIVDWKPIANSFNRYNVGKTLLIMDCCFAAELATYDGPELLAACGWDSQASSEAHSCLTRILIDELRRRNGVAATVAEIFSAMHRDTYSTNLGGSIVHVPRMHSDSIVLEKLGSKRTKAESFSARQAAANQFLPSQYRVLISVNLQNDITPPGFDQWKKWLPTNIPSGQQSADVQIESVFPAGSSLVLVTVPTELWTMLPINDEAYRFVGFVKGHGAVPTGVPTGQTVLTLRPRGTENVLPSHRRGQSDDIGGAGKRR